MLVVRGAVVLCVRRLLASSLPVKWLARVGFYLLPPAGAHDVSAQRKQLSAPLGSVATVAGPGSPAAVGCSRHAVDTPARPLCPSPTAVRIRRRCRRVKGLLGFGEVAELTTPAMIA